MERFIKREHRDDLIFCLMGLSQAYHDAGLLWAARSCALAATERCFAYFHETGTIVRRSLLCLQQLESMELLLGRIPQVLMARRACLFQRRPKNPKTIWQFCIPYPCQK